MSGHCPLRKTAAFTLIELLVSVAVLSVLMMVLSQVLSDTQATWGRAKARTEEFREARAAFEAIAARLSQATLNSYWGYKLDANGNPLIYQRQSELHYVNGPVTTLLGSAVPAAGHAVFFQAPLGENLDPGSPNPASTEPYGLESMINAWGWYVTYDSDLPRRPAFLGDTPAHPERKRFRLMEFRQPTEKLSLYRLVTPPNGDATSTKIPWLEAQNSQNGLYDWFRSDLAADSQPVAENILAIFVQPVWPMPGKDTGADTSAAPNYLYDTRRHQWPDTTTMAERSRHQLPPMIRLTLVALDERDWSKLDSTATDALATQLRTLANTKVFITAAEYENDVKKLESELVNLNLGFRVFSTAVQIPAAKLMSSREN
ncbi:Verru_Chthon cassette protein C [Verrucomicrobium spinosum]|uniref:Verru_Chthon cassette protein C n=2 Tax=Verrucomicrobium spinosum TaxID=2736 RepID=UPI0001745D84|nr:Verru_Chthon cassette protein C [Verrucomicrobium spinosum]